MVSGDANADGIGTSQQNDMFYVPKDSNDIALIGATAPIRTAQFDSLNKYINGESCLGVYAEVLEPGIVRVGDEVEVL